MSKGKATAAIGIVCVAIRDGSDLVYSIPGSRTGECSECESMVSVGPAAQAFMAAHHGATVVLCHRCAARKPEDELDLQGPLPGALDELHRHGRLIEVRTDAALVSWFRRNRLGRA